MIFRDIEQIPPTSRLARKEVTSSRVRLEKHSNAIKQALQYQRLLDSGQADSQSELAPL
jgi:hypothetical protein